MSGAPDDEAFSYEGYRIAVKQDGSAQFVHTEG